MMNSPDIGAFPGAYFPALPACIGAITVAKGRQNRARERPGEFAAHLPEGDFVVVARAVADQGFYFGQELLESFAIGFTLFQALAFAAHLAVKLS